jgi:alkylation response protein AidB-like acyl-CoA dehydrogenase
LGIGALLIDKVKPEEIFIPEDMNEEQKLLGQIIEEFLRGEIEPQIEGLELQSEGLMTRLLRKSAEVGLLGVDIPEDYGGTALDEISSLIVAEKVAIGGPFAVAYLAHTAFACPPILRFGSKDQKRRYLPDLGSGRKIGAYAQTEPDAGTDALNAKTIATLSKDGQLYVLNGEKQFITNAGVADIFVTYAKLDGDKLTAFVVEKGMEGLSFGDEETKMGIHGSSTRGLVFQDLKVPVANRLFQIGNASMVALATLNIGRFRMGGVCLGAAKVAFDASLRYAKSRVQFGQTISSFGLVKEKIAEMAIRIFVSESMLYRTASLLKEMLKSPPAPSTEGEMGILKNPGEYAQECSINKVYASEMLAIIADEAVQLHGGYGYIKELPIERYYRDARIYRIFGGTNEINRLLITKLLVKSAIEGRLPLLQSMEKAVSTVENPSAETPFHDESLNELGQLLRNTKKVALLLLLALVRSHYRDLQSQEEMVAMVSNVIIEAFAMESCLLRSEKIFIKFGKEKSEIPIAISQVYVFEALLRVERWAKILLGAMVKVQRPQDLLNLTNMTGYLQFDSVTSRRKIADYMFKAGRYVVA